MQRPTPEDIGLIATNCGAFYFHFALPLVRRHELIKAERGEGAFAAERAADYDYLAVRAVAAFNHETKGQGLPYALRIHADLPDIADYLRSHYATGHDPQTKPMGGDLVRQVPVWQWGAPNLTPDSLGMMGGAASFVRAEDGSTAGAPGGGSVTFNRYAGGFLGNHGPTSIAPEYCSCSGGPATIHSDYANARFKGEFAVAHFWRWRDFPQRDGGEAFTQIRPVWNLDLNKA